MEIVTSFSDSPFLWFFANMFAVIPNILAAISQPDLWLDWISWDNTKEDKQSLMRFIYYGASIELFFICLLYTSPSPRDREKSRMPSSA